jgi:hypothetical protein
MIIALPGRLVPAGRHTMAKQQPLTAGRPLSRPPRRAATTRRARALTAAAAAALALAAPLATGQAPAARAATGPAASHHKGQAPGTALPQDLSGGLPSLGLTQDGSYLGVPATGDFVGNGHAQMAYIKDGYLYVQEAPKYGGGIDRKSPVDLNAPPNDGWEWGYCNGQPCSTLGVWGGNNHTVVGARYDMASVKVAFDGSHVFLAGARWSGNPAEDNGLYHLWLLSEDGPCGTSCTRDSVNLPSVVTDCGGGTFANVVTAMATGVVGGRELLAVGLADGLPDPQHPGLNDDIYIYDVSGGYLREVARLPGTGCDQKPITSLSFGPPTGPGQGGLLAASAETGGDTMWIYQLNPDGTMQSMHSANGDMLVMASAVANINGQQVAVFGQETGGSQGTTVFVVNPKADDDVITKLDPSLVTGDVVSLTPVTPPGGSPTNQDLIVGAYGGADHPTDQVLQYVGSGLQRVPVREGGVATATNDQIDYWYPGYGAGRLTVKNDTAGDVSVAMHSREDPSYGCWLQDSVPDAPAFPGSDIPVAAGQTSQDYFIGALTAGPNGDCASAQPQSKGEHAAYITVTPAGDPADEHQVKLSVDQAGTVSIAEQAGGYLTASLSRASTSPGSWGSWVLTLTGGATPAAVTAPTVTGQRLTVAASGGGPDRPVYRFDVSGATWAGAAAPGQVTTRIPAMTAQGSTDGGQRWNDLGQLMPATAPSRNADTVTLGPASFFWQDQPGDTPLSDVRVVSGGKASAPVVLKDLPPPPPDSTYPDQISSLSVRPANSGGNAAPRADGVDQATLGVDLSTSDGKLIKASDPRYKLIYYRYDVSGSIGGLVTGLYQPGDYHGYTAVGPWPGPNASQGGGTVDNYLVTTSTATHYVEAEINDTGHPATSQQDITVAATANPLTVPAGQTAAGGISVTGCTGSPTTTCPLAAPAPAAPALYQAGDTGTGPVTGLLLTVTAVTGRASLPLQVGTGNAHHLGSASLTVTPSSAMLTDTSPFWPTDTIDTVLVTSGELVPALSVPVGGK